MRRAAGLVLLAFAGVLTAVALGNQARGELLPTVSLPTTTLPPLPSVTTPVTVPKPDPPPIVTVPAAPPAGTGSTTAAPTPSRPASGRRQGSARGRSRSRRPSVSFRLRAPARVVFTVYGPRPSCGVAGTKTVHGRRGMNWIPVTRRFGRRRLEPGIYRVDVAAQHGGRRRQVGRTGMRVPRRGRAHRAVAPVLHCSTAPAAALRVSQSSSTPKDKASPTAHQQGFRPPRLDLPRVPLPGLPLGNGSGGLISLRTLQLALLAAILAITGAVLAYTVRFYRRIGNP